MGLIESYRLEKKHKPTLRANNVIEDHVRAIASGQS